MVADKNVKCFLGPGGVNTAAGCPGVPLYEGRHLAFLSISRSFEGLIWMAATEAGIRKPRGMIECERSFLCVCMYVSPREEKDGSRS